MVTMDTADSIIRLDQIKLSSLLVYLLKRPVGVKYEICVTEGADFASTVLSVNLYRPKKEHVDAGFQRPWTTMCWYRKTVPCRFLVDGDALRTCLAGSYQVLFKVSGGEATIESWFTKTMSVSFDEDGGLAQ